MVYVLYAGYFLGVIGFLAMVLLEGRGYGLPWTPLRVAGVVACFFWPLAIAAVIAIVIFQNFKKSDMSASDVGQGRAFQAIDFAKHKKNSNAA